MEKVGELLESKTLYTKLGIKQTNYDEEMSRLLIRGRAYSEILIFVNSALPCKGFKVRTCQVRKA